LWSWRSQIAVLAQKILQQSDFDLFLADHALEGGDLFLFLLQLIVSAEGLRADVLELLFPRWRASRDARHRREQSPYRFDQTEAPYAEISA
jgi:hypothetical protein